MAELQLQAVVIGAGWAAEGHTQALQRNGVHVQAICARQPEVVQAVAQRLGVPEASTDWRRTLETIQPDIVSLATPASFRREVIEAAARLGCHIYCDKPLAPTGPEARQLLDTVDRAGIKHAYAATGRYRPNIIWLAELVADGVIGQVREVDIVWRLAEPLPAAIPWGWWRCLAAGGGWLNNLFPHVLAQLELFLGMPVQRIAGESRTILRRAPVIPGIHDFRQVSAMAAHPPSVDVSQLEWRDCDGDDAASMLMEFGPRTGRHVPVLVTYVISGLVQGAGVGEGWRVYGTTGVLTMTDQIMLQRAIGSDPEPMPVPQRIIDALRYTQAEDDVLIVQWAALAREFVADIRAQPHQPYLTFHDGWRYQEAIDVIRSGRGWQDLPSPR